jgi:uncharacterized protein Smg (DUF494 family)
MNLIELLEGRAEIIINGASEAMQRTSMKHYDAESPEKLRKKLTMLYHLTERGVNEKNVFPMVSYVEKMAEERFAAGFDLQEVQTAINVLEDYMWRQITEDLPAGAQADALRIISSILGGAKDALARKYVDLYKAVKT